MSWRILNWDCREMLATLPAGSVQTCVTSPPYFGLRSYGGGDAEIGTEPTPDEFVQALVEVFREVWRVLRDDGTVWLNLGDSYATTSTYNAPRTMHAEAGWKEAGRRPNAPTTDGSKAKDLIGVPWKVAEALKAPYYTGTIKDERDRIWLAAMIDAEGCMFIHKRPAGQRSGANYVRKDGTVADYKRVNATYGSGLEVSSTDRCIVDRIMEITGRGSICEQTPQQNPGRKQTIYRWNLRSNECRDVIREVYPHLVAKQYEARLVLACPSSGSDAERAHESLKAIHQGGTPGIDFAAPESMFERGWTLRSDIIWSKLPMPNPMPESVTDRPTKSHEYLFLLSKGPRYFYDADAVREEHTGEFLSSGARNPRYGRADGLMPHESRGEADQTPARRALIATGDSHGGGNFPNALNPAGRNKRSVWTVATQPYAGAHFATFPPKLIEPCVLAGSPPKCCGECGAPWRRVVERTALRDRLVGEQGGAKMAGRQDLGLASKRTGLSGSNSHNASTPQSPEVRTVGWESTCTHDDDTGRSVVLDPFAGAGTTGMVALRHDRSFIGIELNPAYAEMARNRIRDDAPLLNTPLEAAA